MSSTAKRSQNVYHSRATQPPPASTLVEVSPPSTPSRLSASTGRRRYTSTPSNISSPMYPAPSKPHPFCEDDTGNEHLAPQQDSAQFDVSSASSSHGSCISTPTPTMEATIARASLESVSLEQHLQHHDTGREEAMQSFILDRFLPAAKAMATDHDRTPYTASKQHSMKPSVTSHTSTPNSTKSAARLYSLSSTSSAFKGVTWSSPLSQDEVEMDDEEPAKSSGFFCVGLKTAISRVHKVVHPSAHSMSRSKSKAPPLHSNGASGDEEEDVLPKVHVMSQGMPRQRSAETTASYAFSSNSSTVETIRRGMPFSYMLSSRNSFSRNGHVGRDGSPFASRTSLDASPLRNMSLSGHSISPPRQQPKCNCYKQSPLRGNAWQCSVGLPCDQSCANSHWEHAENSPGRTRLKDYHSHNAFGCIASNVSVQDPANRASSRGSVSMVHHDGLEDASGDLDLTEDDEHEFYDALDSWSSTPGDLPPSRHTSPKSPEISGSTRKLTADEDGVVDGPNHIETPHVSNLSCKTSSCHAHHEGNSNFFSKKQEISFEGCAWPGSAHIAAVKQRHEKTRADQGKESLSQTMNGTFSLKPSLASPHGHQNGLSSPRPGWPLGISGFRSDTRKSFSQEQATEDDRCADSVSAFTESNVSSPRVPPSPTGSWLERAIALNASKPSTLATLQQKEKAVVSVKKKLQFTSSDKKKEVKWEDVVKGSQVHPEHFRFSEELRHRHPCNRNAIKPLKL